MDSRTSSSGTNDTSSSPITEHQTNAETFVQNLAQMVDKNDVQHMMETQRAMMARYEKTNEMLLNFNVLSSNRYQTSVQDFKKHTQVMGEMKKDLDTIFKRIRKLKANLNVQYPDAFHQSMENLREEDDVTMGGDDVTPKMSVSDSLEIRKVIPEEPEAEVNATTG